MKRLCQVTLFSALFLCTLFLPSVGSAATLARPSNNLGINAYWNFNEGGGTSLGDFSGNKVTGTLSGSTLPTWVAGKTGKALYFNGSTAYVATGNPSSLNISGDLTISVWVNPTALIGGTCANPIIVSRTSNVASPYNLYIRSGSILFQNHLLSGGDVNGWQSFNQSTTMPLNTWTHVVITRGGGNVNIYKNGVLLSTTALNGAVDPSYNGAYIARDNGCDSIDNYYNGAIDDLRIYNRMLAASEVAGLYTTVAQTLKPLSKNNLVGYWNFNEGTSTKAGDVSGQGNTATLSGSSLPVWNAGRFGGGLLFDGSASYADAGNNSSINFGANQDFSISLWVKTSASPGSAKPLAKYNVDTTGLGWGFYQSSNAIYLKVADGSSVRYEQSVSPINDGQWHHIVYSVTRAGNCVRYKDGALVGTTDCSAWASVDFSTNNRNLYMGANNNSNTPNSYWSGSLDDIRLYNKALTASDVAALYKTGSMVANVNTATGALGSGLVGYWSFNGADITDQIYERVGGYNGYLVGTNNATSSRKTQGKVGQGFTFAGQNTGGVNLGNSTSLNPNRFTIAAWINTATSTYAYNYIYSNDRDCCGTYNGISLGVGIVGNAGKLVGMIWNSSQYSITSNATVATSTWVHVAYSYDGSNMRLYINGVLDKQQAQTTDPGTPASFNTYLGSMGNAAGVSYTFNGKLDEIRLYNRALSLNEVKQLYNSGK